MSETEETLKQENEVLKAIAELSAKIDNGNARFDGLESKLDKFIEETNIQFEAIRTGIVANNISFERLSAKVSLISANVTEMREEMRQKVTV